MEKQMHYLYPGCIFFSKEPYKITTILGSCVSVCLWDRKNKIGGMNHYIYARYRKSEKKGISGINAIPYLIKLFTENGSRMEDLEAKIVGGANSKVLESSVSAENVQIAKEILELNKIKIKSINIGGFKGRKVVFDNTTGEVEISYLKEASKRVDKDG